MKTLFRMLFLGMVAVAIFVGCAKKTDNNGAYGYPPYPQYPHYPQYPNYPNYPGQPHAKMFAFQGVAQIIDGEAFTDYLRNDFCIRTLFFKTCDPIRLVNNAPIIELRLRDLEIHPNQLNPAILTIRLRTDPNWYINGTNSPTQQFNVNLRYINNNSGFEGVGVDLPGSTGFGAYVTVRGTGKPSDNPIAVDILFNNRTMLRAYLYRFQ